MEPNFGGEIYHNELLIEFKRNSYGQLALHPVKTIHLLSLDDYISFQGEEFFVIAILKKPPVFTMSR